MKVRPELDSLRDHFPLHLGRVQIDLVEAQIDLVEAQPLIDDPKPDEIWAALRVIQFDPDGMIRDIREQSLRLAPHPNVLADAERVGECVAAHVEVLRELFGRPDASEHDVGMPCDLIWIDELLRLRKAVTREQFGEALRAQKRLGKRLG